jgi:hypothetical protein
VSQVAAISSNIPTVPANIAPIVPDVAFVVRNISAVMPNVIQLMTRANRVPRTHIVAVFATILRKVSIISADISAVVSNVSAVTTQIAMIVSKITSILRPIRRVSRGHWNLRNRHRAQSQHCRRDPEHHLTGPFHISHLLIRSFRSREQEPYSAQKGFATLPWYIVT